MHVVFAALMWAQTALAADLELYRFWQPPNVVSVAGLLTIPLQGLRFVPPMGAGRRAATYQVDLSFVDAAGTVLHQERWSQRVVVPGRSIPPGAQAVENLAVDLTPGRYEVRVVVTDSVSGERVELREPIENDGRRPLVSDLVVAHKVERAVADAETPKGSFRRGSMLIAPNLGGVFRIDEATLALYAEVYPPAGQGDTAAVSVIVHSRTGPLRQQTAPARRRYPAEGGVEARQIPLQGLQPGEYAIGLRVDYPDTTITLERPFTLHDPYADKPNPFGELDEFALDSVFKTMTYIATADETRLYEGLTLTGKRRFMQQFWDRRDPTPGPPNEFYDEYEARVRYANRDFFQRGNPQPGWATARGRIYILKGPPGDRYAQPVVGIAGHRRPFEIWKYAGGRGDKYVFFDESGFGNFHLVFSTDPDEPTMPNWRSLFDQETLRLIDSF